MDVGGVQAGFTSVFACPLWFGADQAYTGTAGIVMHLPVGGKEFIDVSPGKEIRCTMRTIQDSDFPPAGVVGNVFGGQYAWLSIFCWQDMQHIPGAQRPSGMPAELPQCKSGAAAQIIRYLNPTLDGQAGSAAKLTDFTES